MRRWIINDAFTYWVTQLKTSKNSADVSKGSYSTVRFPIDVLPWKKKEKAKVRRAIIGVIGTRARVNRISQIRFRSREYFSLGNGVSVDYGEQWPTHAANCGTDTNVAHFETHRRSHGNHVETDGCSVPSTMSRAQDRVNESGSWAANVVVSFKTYRDSADCLLFLFDDVRSPCSDWSCRGCRVFKRSSAWPRFDHNFTTLVDRVN